MSSDHHQAGRILHPVLANRMSFSIRGVKIFVVRKKMSLLLCIGLFLFFLMIHEDKNARKAKKTRPKYNLMEEGNGHHNPNVKECTLDYANTNRLQQDHPCVLELIREQYIKEPFPHDVPMGLHNFDKADSSAGQTKAIMRILQHKTDGFFVECGASDGEFLSNTLYMERFKNWTGLLIEPDPASYQSLLTRKRRSWHIPACLSLEMYPTQVTFKSVFQTGSIQEKTWFSEGDYVTVQCFPFYSVLLAYGRKSVDFFSLDVEGHELKILKTIPWHKVDITTIAVEWEHVEEGPKAIEQFMEDNGFVTFGRIATRYARDIIFVKDYLRDLRPDYDYEDE